MKRAGSRTVVSQVNMRETFKLDKDIMLLKINDDFPDIVIKKYEIEGIEYERIPVSDLERTIAINANGDFVGKTVYFLN